MSVTKSSGSFWGIAACFVFVTVCAVLLYADFPSDNSGDSRSELIQHLEKEVDYWRDKSMNLERDLAQLRERCRRGSGSPTGSPDSGTSYWEEIGPGTSVDAINEQLGTPAAK